jgi:hypothetical protein
MTLKLDELTTMPEEELVGAYDQMAENLPPNVSMFRDELNRRAYERDAEAMRRLTEQTVRLTERTVRLTVVNSAVAVLALIVAVITLIATK